MCNNLGITVVLNTKIIEVFSPQEMYNSLVQTLYRQQLLSTTHALIPKKKTICSMLCD